MPATAFLSETSKLTYEDFCGFPADGRRLELAGGSALERHADLSLEAREVLVSRVLPGFELPLATVFEE